MTDHARRSSGGGRLSLHEEPVGAVATARHYIRDLVYGANDGLITTFAVVAGVVGGGLSALAVLIVGAANVVAVGNYLSIRSHESALAAQDRPEEEANPARHGLATLAAFVAAGAVPLVPFALGAAPDAGFVWSVALTFAMLFTVGALRGLVTVERWWIGGLEMLLLGLAVAVAAYGSGLVASRLVAGS
jgi:VIT1/CCC1 family predicted Fe2+/Mn2+ transporter